MTTTLRGISIEGREARDTLDGTEYTFVAKVMSDDKNDGAAVVLATPGLPAIGDLYSTGNDFDPNAIITDRDPRQTNSPYEWEVVLTANTNVPENPLNFLENPLLEPPEISFGFATRTVLVANYFDDPANPPADRNFTTGILAPNGEPFEPPPVAEYDDPVTTITRNYATLNPETLRAANNSVNATFFQGANPRTLRLRANARPAWHKAAGNYWVVTFNLVYRWETWDIQRPNRGTYYWAGGYPGGTRTPVKVEGRPVLVNLTTDGDLNTSTTLTFTRIRYYRELDFNTLGIL